MHSLILSDVHLLDMESLRSQLVLRFLQEVASRFQNIIFLGDLFDVWPGTDSFLIKKFEPLLKMIDQLVKDGHQVHYIEGNHDFRLGRYFSEELKVKVYAEKFEFESNGKKILMMHGDLGNPKEYGYRILRKILRNPLLHAGKKIVPEEWIYKLGARTSSLSRNYQKLSSKKEEAIKKIYRETADKYFREGYDVVVMGHTHLPDVYETEFQGRSKLYYNTGDWLKNYTYLEFDGNQFYTKTHPLKES